MSATDRIAVVGGGIAGLAVAVGLRRAGARVTVFEQAPELRASGGALLLWSNGVTATRALGLSERLLDVATPIEHTEFRTADGRLIWCMPVGDLSRSAGAPTVVVARRELLHVLVSGLGDTEVRCASRIEGFEEDGDQVVLRVEDRPAERFDGLIGADGLRSVIRERLLGAAPPRSVGHAAWVGIADYTSRHLPLGRSVATLGHGLRFCAAAMRGERVFWYASAPLEDPVSGLSWLADQFRVFHRPVQDVIRATRPEAAVRTEVRDHAPARAWGRGRVTLAGDSAHACTPDLGQGACQSIESAVILSARVARRPIPAAFASYEDERRPRTGKITNFAYLTARQSMSRSPIAAGLRSLAMWTLFPAVATREVQWILGEHGISAADVAALSGGDNGGYVGDIGRA